jgi:uncharacterized protein (TIGR03437 family)
MTTRRNTLTKLFLLTLTSLLIAFAYSPSEDSVQAFSLQAPPLSRTGAPAFGSMIPAEPTCILCHRVDATIARTGSITVTGLPASYTPGQEYTLTVTVTHPARNKFGFELTVLDSTGKQAGTLANVDTVKTTVRSATFNGLPRQYASHAGGAASTTVTTGEKNEWSIKWTAPATASGKLGVYAAGNATNTGGTNANDVIYTFAQILQPPVENLNAASFDKPRANTASGGGILSAFGEDLAFATASATGDADPNTPGIQLPTNLSATTVRVRDALNVERNAGLFFVSPTQVNYMVPEASAPGAATVTITNGNGTVSTGTLTIADVNPGIFTAKMDGTGLPAAEIQRVRNGQTLGFEAVATGPAANPTAVPIEWKDPNDVLYLVLYGTGVRKRSQLSNVTAVIGAVNHQVVFAGAHGTFAGVDQVNIQLNRGLAGSGTVNVILGVDGRTANTVQVNYR